MITKLSAATILFVAFSVSGKALANQALCGKIQHVQRQTNTGPHYTVRLHTGETVSVREAEGMAVFVTAMSSDLTACFRKLGPESYMTDSFSK